MSLPAGEHRKSTRAENAYREARNNYAIKAYIARLHQMGVMHPYPSTRTERRILLSKIKADRRVWHLCLRGFKYDSAPDDGDAQH